MKKIYKILLVMFICFCLFGASEVNALCKSVKKGSDLTYTGWFKKCGANWDYTVKKTIGGHTAYCVEEQRHAPSSACKTDNTFGIKSGKFSNSNRLWSSLAIEVVKGKGYSSNKEYAYLFGILNSYNKIVNKKGYAVNFTSCSSSLENIYDEIEKKYNQVKTIFKPDASKFALPTPTISSGNYTMHKYGNYWMSSLVTVSNLQKTVADGIAPTYTITANRDGAFICHGDGSSAGVASTCQKSVTVSNDGDGNYGLYVKVTGVSATTSPQSLNNLITVSGTVSRKFQKPVFYYKDPGQDIIVHEGTYTLKATTNNNRALNIPAVTTTTTTTPTTAPVVTTTAPKPYEILVSKIDEHGQSLPGANFKVSINGTSHDMSKISGSESDFRYLIPNVNGMGNLRICWEETQHPEGYLKSTTDESCMTVNPYSQGNACYDDTDSKVESDNQYCSNNVNMCKVRDSAAGTLEYKEFHTGGRGCDEYVPAPGVTSTKVCYNTATNEEVTDDACTETGLVNKCKVTSTATSEATYEDVPDGGDCASLIPPTTVTAEDVCYDTDGKREVAEKYCADDRHTYATIEYENGELSIMVENKTNYVNISKKQLTGDKEVPGAILKICTKDDYDKDKTQCEPAKNVDKKDLTWTSSDEAATVYGVKVGDYYIVETIPPYGYKVTSIATEFSIDNDGKVTTGKKEVTDNLVVINNELNSMSISKTDLATTKELPGAELMICEAVEVISGNEEVDDSETTPAEGTTSEGIPEEVLEGDVTDEVILTDICDTKKKYKVELDTEGECRPVILADNSEAKWTSGTTPHTVTGLNAGTYFLVERTAPKGFATAESIQFSMLRDGTLVNKNCRSLKNSKITMKDATIQQVKTGNAIIIASIVILIGVSMMFGYYVVSHSPGYAGGIIIGRHSAARIRRGKIHK